MKKLIIIGVLFLLVTTLGFGQRFQKRILAQKIAFFTNELALTPKESEKFWPIYHEHHNKIRALKRSERKRDKENKDWENLSDREIEKMIAARFQLKEQAIDLERSFVKKLRKIMPLQKIIQIPRVEKQFRKWLFEQRKRVLNKRR